MSKRALYIFIIGVLTAALLSLAVQPCYAEDIPSTGWEWVWFNETKLNNSVQYRGFYENKIDYRNEFVYTYQDPEEVNGKTYLVMYTNQNTYDIFYLSNGSMIIENIGYLNIDAPSENNSISGSFFDYLNLTEGYRIYMTLSLFGGKYIFDDILDGGTNGIEAVPAWNRFDRSGKVYDLSGRELKSTPASGIYIRNGMKFVVK